ncbi:hypothetical protein B0T10DRAFT_553842 [Thelonectria olida]|uniref:Uncharacterized protein n=1 Tax=Thelonectria olida TaxID=1576542 RepID=A0A9P9AHJ6_9HYPO|nr:hypothetical protein B0T10DRAFT_553842 [Thelonectria olida]
MIVNPPRQHRAFEPTRPAKCARLALSALLHSIRIRVQDNPIPTGSLGPAQYQDAPLTVARNEAGGTLGMPVAWAVSRQQLVEGTVERTSPQPQSFASTSGREWNTLNIISRCGLRRWTATPIISPSPQLSIGAGNQQYQQGSALAKTDVELLQMTVEQRLPQLCNMAELRNEEDIDSLVSSIINALEAGVEASTPTSLKAFDDSAIGLMEDEARRSLGPNHPKSSTVMRNIEAIRRIQGIATPHSLLSAEDILTGSENMSMDTTEEAEPGRRKGLGRLAARIRRMVKSHRADGQNDSTYVNVGTMVAIEATEVDQAAHAY